MEPSAMFISSPNTTPIVTTPVTLTELKSQVFMSWFYADVEFIVDDRDYPFRAFEVMKEISIGLRAIAIMHTDDIDAQKLWRSVSPYLKHMIDQGWQIRVGEHEGSLCIRIVDVENACTDATVDFQVPPEGTRQLRNVDAWCGAMGAIV